MKSLRHRLRYKQGKTDYYIRKKLISGTQNYTRIRYGKKSNYIYVGLHQTLTPDKPDVSLYYFESRWLRREGKICKPNRETAYVVGSYLAKKLNQNRDRKYVLDLGRQKKICYVPFLAGLIKNLSPEVVLKHGISAQKLESHLVPTEKYELKESK